MIAARQCKAARAMLDWTQADLALRAGVAASTVADFERGVRIPIANNLEAMQRAMELGGMCFLYDGVVPVSGLRWSPEYDLNRKARS